LKPLGHLSGEPSLEGPRRFLQANAASEARILSKILKKRNILCMIRDRRQSRIAPPVNPKPSKSDD
ncbi:MAG: hypothetical protein ACREDY_25485, partial [Bradyrhizobium sp.]